MGMNVRTYCFDVILRERFEVNKGLGLTEAASKEQFYGFEAGDIVRVYFHKQGFGAGLFFRLRDGRVIDSCACEHNGNPILYEETMH
jgi:hypothetical protein